MMLSGVLRALHERDAIARDGDENRANPKAPRRAERVQEKYAREIEHQ
jgi:hypothetical protein